MVMILHGNFVKKKTWPFYMDNNYFSSSAGYFSRVVFCRGVFWGSVHTFHSGEYEAQIITITTF
jgi:hypothetical protein